MNTNSPTDAAASGWLRRNGFWLLGALVLGSLAFALPYRSALREQERRAPQHAIEVAAGDWGDYEDSRWRVVEVRRVDGLKPGAAGYLSAPASLLAVTYEVIPGATALSDRLDRCESRLSHADGRRWRAGSTSLSRLLGPRDELGNGCGSRLGRDFERVRARADRPFRFRHLYLVPAAQPERELRAELLLPPASGVQPSGHYLRFSL